MIKVLSEDVSIFQISFICSSLSTVILSILSHYTGVSSEERAPNGLLVLLGGIFAAIGLLTSAVATSLLPLSEYAFMSNSFPGPIPVTVSISLHVAVLCPVVVTAVLSWLFGMEQLGPVSWISAIGCLCGNALLASPPFLFGQSGDWGMSRIGGIACAASANVAFGLSFIILRFLLYSIGVHICHVSVLRYLGTSVNATALGAGIHAIVVLCSLPFVASGYPKELIFVTSWQSNALLIGITVSVVLIHCMLSRAFQGGSAIRSREAFLTNMLISCALGVMVLAEGMTWTTLTGDALIMVSVLFVVTRTSPEDAFQHVTRSGIKNQIIELTT